MSDLGVTEIAVIIAGILAVLAWISSTITALTVRRIYRQVGPLLSEVAGVRAALAEARALIAEVRPALALVAEVRPLIAEVRPVMERIDAVLDDPLAVVWGGLDAAMADPATKAAYEARLQWVGRSVARGAVAHVREQAGKTEGGGGGGGAGGIIGMILKGVLGKHAPMAEVFLPALTGGGGSAPTRSAPSDIAERMRSGQ